MEFLSFTRRSKMSARKYGKKLDDGSRMKKVRFVRLLQKRIKFHLLNVTESPRKATVILKTSIIC